jgi:hypothetical protein
MVGENMSTLGPKSGVGVWTVCGPIRQDAARRRVVMLMRNADERQREYTCCVEARVLHGKARLSRENFCDIIIGELCEDLLKFTVGETVVSDVVFNVVWDTMA